jgi:hypothetical protein
MHRSWDIFAWDLPLHHSWDIFAGDLPYTFMYHSWDIFAGDLPHVHAPFLGYFCRGPFKHIQYIHHSWDIFAGDLPSTIPVIFLQGTFHPPFL